MILWFCRTCEFEQENNSDAQICNERDRKVAWPSGLRRWFKAPVSSEAWVRIPPLPKTPFFVIVISFYSAELVLREPEIFIHWPNGLGVWFLLWVQEVPGSNPGWALVIILFCLWCWYRGSKINARGHSDLNQGPTGLQPGALPLSYIPNHANKLKDYLYIYIVS